jgi:pimeloyl-ACP methyl ester carboxylesterase
MQKTLTFRETTVAYEDTGKGKVLVLIHGFAEDATVWRHQVKTLQEKFRLIVPDLPGSGLSPLWLEKEALTMDILAQIVEAILEHERIAHCCCIGHSMGGYATLAFAEAFPGYLKGWGLFHSTAFADSPEKQQARRNGIAAIQANGVAPFLTQMLPGLFGAAFKEAHADDIEALIQRSSSMSGAALIQYYEAMLERPDRRKVLEASAVPVLLILGAQDNVVPFTEGLQLAALSTTTFLHALPEAAHMGMWEAHFDTTEALLQYCTFIFRH